MNNIQFDEHGYLKPYEGIEATVETLKEFFVNGFRESHSRQALFGNYRQYTKSFKQRVFPYFEQWVNGSFVSLNPNPRDIDVVAFLDYRVFSSKEKLLDEFLSFSLEAEGIDAYIVPVFPEGHENFLVAERFKGQWYNRFTSTKANEADRIFRKGFLKIKFEPKL